MCVSETVLLHDKMEKIETLCYLNKTPDKQTFDFNKIRVVIVRLPDNSFSLQWTKRWPLYYMVCLRPSCKTVVKIINIKIYLINTSVQNGKHARLSLAKTEI